jgi:two-component system response regulator MprA
MQPKLPLQLSGKEKKGNAPLKEKLPFVGDEAGIEPQASAGQNRKVLVVDDNPVVLKAFELKLKGSGFVVNTAMDGAAAVSAVGRDRPDLIILDINFPPGSGASGLQWNGLTIMQWMRRFQEAASIPIIILTGGDPAEYKAKCLAAGAVGFFQKPVEYKEFLPSLLKILGDSPKAAKAN